MAFDMALLHLRVDRWSQTITHGEKWPQHQLRASARTSDSEELMFGADGHRRLRNVPVELTIIRGAPAKLPDRGIGVLAYNPERPPHEDVAGIVEFLGGWFWLPEALHDEVWAQAREHRYDQCVAEIEFAPVELTGLALRWNIEKNKIASIVRAGVRFERALEPPADPDTASAAPSKKGGRFALGG